MVFKNALYLKRFWRKKKSLGNKQVLFWKTKKIQLFHLSEKKINLCVLWFDLNQILLQIPASAFDSGGKKTKPPNPNHFDATTQKPLIIIVIIIGIIFNFGTKGDGFRGGWLFPSA